jgi:hypothetical protein
MGTLPYCGKSCTWIGGFVTIIHGSRHHTHRYRTVLWEELYLDWRVCNNYPRQPPPRPWVPYHIVGRAVPGLAGLLLLSEPAATTPMGTLQYCWKSCTWICGFVTTIRGSRHHAHGYPTILLEELYLDWRVCYYYPRQPPPRPWVPYHNVGRAVPGLAGLLLLSEAAATTPMGTVQRAVPVLASLTLLSAAAATTPMGTVP